MSRLALGFDPGYANLGVAALDLDTNAVELMIYDLTTYQGEAHDLTYQDFGPLVHDFVLGITYQGFPICWANVKFIAIEKQPIVGTRNVLQVAASLYSALKMYQPQVPIFQVEPRSVRAWVGTQGTDYADRKRKSMEVNVFPERERKRLRSTFTKKGKFHVDGVEAGHLVLYVARNLDKLTTVPCGVDEPRRFASLHFTTRV